MIDQIVCAAAGAVAGVFSVLIVQAFREIQRLNRAKAIEEEIEEIISKNWKGRRFTTKNDL